MFFFPNMRLCQLVENLEEKWRNRVSIYDIKTKQKVGLDEMGRTYGYGGTMSVLVLVRKTYVK